MSEFIRPSWRIADSQPLAHGPEALETPQACAGASGPNEALRKPYTGRKRYPRLIVKRGTTQWTAYIIKHPGKYLTPLGYGATAHEAINCALGINCGRCA